jgi:hypothetical protein
MPDHEQTNQGYETKQVSIGEKKGYQPRTVEGQQPLGRPPSGGSNVRSPDNSTQKKD